MKLQQSGPIYTSVFRGGYLWLAGSVVLGALLRLVGLDRQGFWTDELYVVWEARQPLPVIFDPRLHVQHPPGYRLALHSWLGLGLGETWIRLLPALAGILLIPVAWMLVRALWPSHPGAAGSVTLLVATSPFLVHYSQDVTTYSWTMLWVTISVLLLVYAWRIDSRWLWAAWAISMAGALYSHYFSIFPLAVEGAATLALGIVGGRAVRGRLVRAVFAMLGAVVLYIPWLWTLMTTGRDVVGATYLFPASLDTQPVRWLPSLLMGYAHGAFWQSPAGVWAAWLVLCLAGAWGVWRLARKRAVGARTGVALALAWGVAAIVGPYLFLRITTPPNDVDPVRFAALAVPALLLGLGAAISTLPAPVRVPVLAAWLVMAGVQWQAEYTSPTTQDWRGVMGAVAARSQPGDVMLAFPAFHAGAAAAYYSVPMPVRGGWFVGEGSDPAGAAYWFHPGWQWRGFLDPVARRSTDWSGELQARTTDARRIWYLAGDGVDGTYPTSIAAEQALASTGWRSAQEWRASPLVLKLYVKGGQ